MIKNDEKKFRFKLSVREVIPHLKLPDNKQKETSTWDFKQFKNLIIFFHHGTQCACCRQKLRALASAYPKIKELEAEILAVSFDSVKDLKNLATKEEIPFLLLSDMDRNTTLKFTYVDDEKDSPYPSIFITDRYGELRKQEIATEADRLLDEKQILNIFLGIQIECPECSHL